MSSCDALQIGLMLSQQEIEFGVNMYDSLEDSDEPAIRRLVAQGYSNDEAVLEIFNRKFGKTGPQTKWSGVSPAAPVANRLLPPGPNPNYPYPYPYNQGPPPPPPPPPQQQQQQQPYRYDPGYPAPQPYPPSSGYDYDPQYPPPYPPQPQYRHEMYPPDQRAYPMLAPLQPPPPQQPMYHNQSMYIPPNPGYDLRPPPINVSHLV
jgi:hypothetical protein